MSKYVRAKYVNIPIAYDIETTNYRDDGEKASIVYAHTFSVDGEIYHLRTWEEVYEFMDKLAAKYNADLKNRVAIYVHNLAYEFGFMRRYFEWEEVMSVGNVRRVVRATTKSGIEFRCSLVLTNSSLEFVGREVGVKKLVGDLDYRLIRHQNTVLTDKEWGYIDNDVQIIIALIRQRIKQDGSVANIPMTKTGYVRRSIRKIIRNDIEYTSLISRLPLSVIDYKAARDAFQGGYVHANATYTGKVTEGVTGVDLGSSYPASMIKGHYPMTPFTEIPNPSIGKLKVLMGRCCMLIDVTLKNITSKYPFPPISISKVLSSKVVAADNGRVFNAAEVRIVVTDVDFRNIVRAYDIEGAAVNSISAAESGHLPRQLGDAVLSYYGDKTKLKGDEAREEEYKLAKENVNSIFGMVATNPVREEYSFNHETKHMETIPGTTEESLESHNKSRSRFLYYPWACWITAYSRVTLLDAMYDLIDAGITVLYCDTDSIYYVTDPSADAIIEKHNARTARALKTYFQNGETDEEIEDYLSPKTIKGDRKPLGMFELDGVYDKFKSLGAKRYAVEKTIDGEPRFLITVSGLAKVAGDYKDDEGNWVKGYVSQKGGMDFFKDEMFIPAGKSGRLSHTYSDDKIKNKMIDHNGDVADVEQWGFIHLEETDWHLSLAADYLDFLETVA